MCIIKDFKKYFDAVTNSVTQDYNFLLIVMNSVFDYSLSGLLVVHKIKNFLCGKQDI